MRTVVFEGTLQYIVVLILSRRLRQKVLTLIYLFAILRAVKK
nr:MAG TPA: hypothetical protein [Caudoviricetes sp.]